jgi:hypothetical protein
MLDHIAKLGQLAGDGGTSTTLADEFYIPEIPDMPEAHLSLYIQVIAGTDFVTQITFERKEGWPGAGPIPAGIDLEPLVSLVEKLPQLQAVSCILHLWSPPFTDIGMQLPSRLPAAAPHMTTLRVRNAMMVGQLPDSWANWTSLQELDLSGNKLN